MHQRIQDLLAARTHEVARKALQLIDQLIKFGASHREQLLIYLDWLGAKKELEDALCGRADDDPRTYAERRADEEKCRQEWAQENARRGAELDRQADEEIRAAKAARAAQDKKWQDIHERHSLVRDGSVYIAQNASMPGLYKIGFTTLDPEARAAALTRQHLQPTPFTIIQSWQTKDPYQVEQRILDALSAHRTVGEFVAADLGTVRKAVESNLIRRNGQSAKGV
jgi:hypothetical protein